MRKLFLLALISYIVFSCAAQVKPHQYRIVFTNASIVDIVHNRILSQQLIAIDGDSIGAVDDTRNSSRYNADQYVNLQNKFVLPGLWDMHIHFRGGDSLVEANRKLLPLFLAYGITTVRECGGDMTASIMEWRRQIMAGQLVGPRIFTSGPKIDGPNPTWAGSLSVETAAQISAALDSLQNLHVDFVKIYDSKISRQAYLATIAEAQQRGLTTSGHMPYTVKLKEAVDRGLDASEHLYYVFKACSSKEDSITDAVIQAEHTAKPIGLFGALPAVYNTYDPATASILFQYLAEKKFSILPTVAISKMLEEIKETDHTKDSLLQYIDPKIHATYAGRVNSAKRQTMEATAFAKAFSAKAASLVPAMFKAGVNIIAGSDCGAFNSFVYPGQSLHEEIKQMVAVGLSPAQALQTATINGPIFMGVAKHYGSIEKGKCSDILVLNENPLADIRAIDNIHLVISHGKLFTKQDRDKLLALISN